MKIQFGSGSNRLDGWVNTDFPEVDITKPLPYADNSVDEILIEHCLEHIDCAQGFGFMKEARRILASGGILRICVPTLNAPMTHEHIADLCVGHGHKMIYSMSVISLMLQAAGLRLPGGTERRDCDGHWRVIGKEKDDLETLRVEAIK